jgi:hypothetical protein
MLGDLMTELSALEKGKYANPNFVLNFSAMFCVVELFVYMFLFLFIR